MNVNIFYIECIVAMNATTTMPAMRRELSVILATMCYVSRGDSLTALQITCLMRCMTLVSLGDTVPQWLC